jgi:BASS family bile acid:Na+ symporter
MTSAGPSPGAPPAGRGFRQLTGVFTLVAGAGSLALFAAGSRDGCAPLALAAFVSLALYCRSHPLLKSFVFTAWVFTFVAASMFHPTAFGSWWGFDLKNLIVPLIQIIMFGMGTTLSLQDFARVLVMPVPVGIGLLFHYTIMPLTGFALAKLFAFPPEIAAGVILIGSVSSGAASNLITYLARGNVALAVTITACSTLVSPLLTPLLMKVLAGKLVPIRVTAMVLEILNMVIVPVVAGLVANRILYGSGPWYNRGRLVAGLAVAGLALAGAAAALPTTWWGAFGTLRTGAILGFGLIAVIALAKLLITILWGRGTGWMDRALPVISMAGICFVIAIITARSREKLLTVGATLILAAMVHNAVGYFFGYWLARAVGQGEVASRTIAIEVGMQNGGMASGLAMGVLQSADAALAPAIFGPWMNISGSVLASWWRGRPARDTPEKGKSIS